MSEIKKAGSAKKRRRLSYRRRKALYGYGFVSLWLLGAVCFFLIPLGKSLAYSFSRVKIDAGAVNLEWRGFDNYVYALNEDKDYAKFLTDALVETAWKTPLILIFSLFIAVTLNQRFRGRTLARAIFFLPVIVATGPVYKIISGDMDSTGNTGAEQFSTMFSTDLVGDLLRFLGIYGISDKTNLMISAVADNVFGIVWSSGVQILIFLAALQNIPSSAKEAATIEGATSWEFFWKITFPYVSPFVLANLVYTVIDTFANPANPVMRRISEKKNDWAFGEASAMAWIYFAVVMIAVAVIAAVAGRRVYYEVE